MELDNKSKRILNKMAEHKIIKHPHTLAEVQQAGLFHIANVPQEAMGQVLGAFCPNILFPYAREAVDSLVSRGSFPTLMLAPVNFDALYAQNVAQQQAAAAEAGDGEAEAEATTH